MRAGSVPDSTSRTDCRTGDTEDGSGLLEVPDRFFIDERRTSGGIRIIDRLHTLIEGVDHTPFANETESRWSLVEAAWALNLPNQLLTVRPTFRRQCTGLA